MKHAIPANLVDFPLTSWLTGGHALLATHNPLQRLLQQRGNMKLSDGARWRSWPASQWERSTSGGIRLQAQLAVLWETAEAKFDHIKGRRHIIWIFTCKKTHFLYKSKKALSLSTKMFL